MMQRLVFNHVDSRVPGPATLLLGLVLLLALAILGSVYYRLAADNAVLLQNLQARQAAIAPAAEIRATPARASDKASTAEIADAQSHIRTPWLPLLSTLEQAQQPQLYWMQLAPDAKRKHIRFTVLASHRQQGWALVERLKRQSGLSDVKLNASETTDVNGLPMTTLHLEAAWKF